MVIAREISRSVGEETACGIKLATSPDGDMDLYKRYEAIAAGIIVYDPTGKIVFANRTMERILNCHWTIMEGKFLRDSTWEFIDDEGKRVYWERFPSARAIIGRQSVHNSILGLKRSSEDSVQWLLVNSIPLFESQTQLLNEIIVTITDITVLRNAAQILRESERRLIFALESIHAGEWELNIQDLSVRYSSRSAEIFLGEERFDGLYIEWSKVLDYFVGEDREKIDRSVREAIQRRQSFEVTGRIVRADGVERWIQASCRPHAEDGFANLSGIVIDITEQKQAERTQRQTLLHSHEIVVKEVVESFGLLHYVVDSDLRYIAFNKLQADLMARLFGAEIALGQNFLSYVNVAAKKSLMERNLRRALDGEVFSFEHYFTFDDPKIKCLAAIYCPIRDENGQILGVSAFGYDPAKPKAAQAFWQANEYRHRKMVESTNLFFVQLNAQGEILYLNRFGCEFFEYDLSGLVGRNFAEVLAPAIVSSRCDLRKVFPRVLCRQFSGTRRGTCELTTRSQKRVWVEWSYHWEEESDQSGPVLIAAGMDVSRAVQIRLQERRDYQQRRRWETLNAYIDGTLSPEEFTRLARVYRISLAYPLMCLLLCPDASDAAREAEKLRQLADWVQDCGEGMVWQAADGVCLVLSLPEDDCSGRDAWVRQKTDDILQQAILFASGISWRCGVSWAADRGVSLAEIYFQARMALAFGPTILGIQTIYFWRDLGSYQLLVRDVQAEGTGRFIEEQLGPLLQLDNIDSQRELLHTLRELGSFDSEEKIAQRLHVHRMTVRYRKAALAKLLHCDLNVARVVINLTIAVQLWALRNQPR